MRNRLSFKSSLAICVAFLVGLMVVFSQSASAVTIPGAVLLEPVGQEQFLVTTPVNLGTSLLMLAVSQKAALFFQQPDDWCNPKTQLGAFRPSHGPVSIIGSLASNIYVGKYRYGIDGDYGYTLIMGLFGVEIGNRLACMIGVQTQSKTAKVVVNLLVPPVLSAVFSIIGYHSHVLRSNEPVETN